MTLERLVLALGVVAAVAVAGPAPKDKDKDKDKDGPEEPVCALEDSVLRPQFTAKLPKGTKLLSSKLDKKARQFSQELSLAEGTKVTVTVGGCDHLSVVFAIRNPAITTKTVGAEVVAICKRVLPQLPVAKEAVSNPKRLLKALDEANIMALPSPLPCGDSTCQLAVEPDEPKAKPGKGAKVKKEKDEPKPEEAAAKPSLEEGPGYIRLSYDQML